MQVVHGPSQRCVLQRSGAPQPHPRILGAHCLFIPRPISVSAVPARLGFPSVSALALSLGVTLGPGWPRHCRAVLGHACSCDLLTPSPQAAHRLRGQVKVLACHFHFEIPLLCTPLIQGPFCL